MASNPALPWGVNAAVAAEGAAPKRDRADDPTEDERARAEKQRKVEDAAARDVSALASVGLKEGARMEVLWKVETGGDAGGGALTAHVRSILLRAFSTPCVCTRLSGRKRRGRRSLQWWGGVVTSFPGAAMYDADGARVWTLTYDAKPALGVQDSDEHLVRPPLLNQPAMATPIIYARTSFHLPQNQGGAPQTFAPFLPPHCPGPHTHPGGALHTRSCRASQDWRCGLSG